MHISNYTLIYCGNLNPGTWIELYLWQNSNYRSSTYKVCCTMVLLVVQHLHKCSVFWARENVLYIYISGLICSNVTLQIHAMMVQGHTQKVRNLLTKLLALNPSDYLRPNCFTSDYTSLARNFYNKILR